MLLGLVASASAQATAVSASVNLRAGPGMGHAVIAVLPKGSVVEVRSCFRRWCEIAYRSSRGYVSQSYLAVTPPTPPKVPPYVGALFAPPHSIGFRDAWTRAPTIPGAGCFVNGALWTIGRPATGEVVERARRGAAARSVQVARHSFDEARAFVPHRLTLAVDKRNVIWGVSCG